MIFKKHEEQDWAAEVRLLRGPDFDGAKVDEDKKWATLVYEIADNLPEHLAEFIRFRQEVGNVRYWCGPVAGKYAAAGLPTPTRLTMHRYWKDIINETVRLALKEGLL